MKVLVSGADVGFLKGGGVQLVRCPCKRGSGDPALGPMLKSLNRGLKGGPDPRTPLPPGSATGYRSVC